MIMIHQKSKKVGSSRKSLTAVIKDPLKLFLLLASLVFVLGACSDGSASNKDTKTQQPSGDNGDDSGDDTGDDTGDDSGDENPEPIETSCFEVDANDETKLIGYYDYEGNDNTKAACSKDVVISEGITAIEDHAFENKNLTSVNLPDGLTSIGIQAFKGNNLESLDIPESVTDIGDSAFAGNSDLELYIFPSSSNPTVGNNAFPNGYAITTKAVCFGFDATDTGKINDYYDNEDDNTSNPACPRDVVIPQGVTSIGLYAFQANSITSVIIPEGVTSIGLDAFQDNSLTSVEIPDSVTSIGEYAFSSNSLTSVEIPESMISIEPFTFGNNSLTSVEIPDSVTSIGHSAFYNNSLTSVEITDSVNSIGQSAFQQNSLTSVIIPDSVITIEKYAFRENSLTSVTIGSGVTSIEDQAFEDNESSMTVCIEAQQSDVTVGSGAFDSGVTPTYETDGDCFN